MTAAFLHRFRTMIHRVLSEPEPPKPAPAPEPAPPTPEPEPVEEPTIAPPVLHEALHGWMGDKPPKPWVHRNFERELARREKERHA